MYPTARQKRFERENHRMKTMRTKYPHGLNNRARDEDINKPVELQFRLLIRGTDRTARPGTKPVPTADTADAIFEQIHLIIDNDIKSAYSHIRVIFKQLAPQILYRNNNPSDLQQNLDQYYIYMLDTIDCKLYRPKTLNKKTSPKNICIINFQNKAIEYIKPSEILNKPYVIAQQPRELQNKENRPVITYKFTNTIRNRVLNYKYTVNSIYVED